MFLCDECRLNYSFISENEHLLKEKKIAFFFYLNDSQITNFTLQIFVQISNKPEYFKA